MRIRAVLVDDEPLAIARLARLLEEHRDTIEVVGTAQSGAEAVRTIHELRPDVVFLDVQMPELDGFDVLERLEYMPWVVFSTAYDRYALQAFDVHSVDYLLKPVDAARLTLAVEKLRRLGEGGRDDLDERIRQAVEALDGRRKQRIRVKTGERIRFVPVSEIAFFRARDKYVEAHTPRGAHLVSESLSKLEADLPAGDFVRVHRSVIVNLEFVDEISRTFAGAYAIRIKGCGSPVLPVSRRYKGRLGL